MCVSIWHAGMHVCSHGAWVIQMQCACMWRPVFGVRCHPVSHSIHWDKVSHLNPKLSDWIILLSNLPWGCLPSTENRGWLPHVPCINTVLGIWTLVLLECTANALPTEPSSLPQLYSFILDFTFLCPTQIIISVVERILSAPTVKWMVPLQMFISVTWHELKPSRHKENWALRIPPWYQPLSTEF